MYCWVWCWHPVQIIAVKKKYGACQMKDSFFFAFSSIFSHSKYFLLYIHSVPLLNLAEWIITYCTFPDVPYLENNDCCTRAFISRDVFQQQNRMAKRVGKEPNIHIKTHIRVYTFLPLCFRFRSIKRNPQPQGFVADRNSTYKYNIMQNLKEITCTWESFNWLSRTKFNATCTVHVLCSCVRTHLFPKAKAMSFCRFYFCGLAVLMRQGKASDQDCRCLLL